MDNSKPQLRRALFIGLGGTGAASLRLLKRRFYEVYGHVDQENNRLPEFVKFLVFDTDKGSVMDENDKKMAFNPYAGGDGKGKTFEVNFDSNEVVGVSAENCKELILNPENEKTFDGWIPLKNVGVIEQLNDLKQGAGQIRLFGRIAFFFNAEKIKKAIAKAINDIQLVDMANEHFSPLDEGAFDLDINIVSSVAGGTGSGMFMDTAIACRDILENGSNNIQGRIRGFFVLPEIFLKAGLPGNFNRVIPNAAGALKEIDLFMDFHDSTSMDTLERNRNYSMSTTIWSPERSPINEMKGSDELTLQYLGQTYSRISGKPFDEVYLIGQSNDAGATFNKVEDLCELVAKGLFSNSVSLSAKLQTLDDNYKASALPFKGKSSWIRAIGVSELIYNSYEVRKHLALSAIDQSIALALSDELEDAKLQELSKNFMVDSNLLESGDTQHLTNKICSSTQIPSFEVHEEDYATLENRLNEKREMMKKGRADMVAVSEKVISTAGGILSDLKNKLSTKGKAIAEIRILEYALMQIGASIEELKSDVKLDEKNLADFEKQRASLQLQISDFLSMNAVMKMLKKSELVELVNAWTENARNTLEGEKMVEARRLGIESLSAFQKEVENLKAKDEREVVWLRKMKDGVRGELASRKHRSIADEYPNAFTINLHVNDMNQEFDLFADENWSQDEFIDYATNVSDAYLQANGTLNNLWASNGEALVDYVVDQGVSKISEISEDRLAMILRSELEQSVNARLAKDTPLGKRLLQLIDRSSPVLNYNLPNVLNQEGLNLNNSLKNLFMICVPDRELVEGFNKVVDKLNEDGWNIAVFPTEDQRDRVTIFRRQIAAPAFALSGARSYIYEYEKRHTKDLKSGELFHVNYNWFTAMKQIDFNLLEGTAESGTIRQKLFTWGLIMGWISWRKDHWFIQTANLKETWQLRRDQLFTKLMMEEDYGKELEHFLQLKQSALFELKDAFNKCGKHDGLKWNFTDYLKNESINPYAASITATNKFGSSYDRVQGGPSARIQLETELEALKTIAEEVKGWG
jgi:hypothetical protein